MKRKILIFATLFFTIGFFSNANVYASSFVKQNTKYNNGFIQEKPNTQLKLYLEYTTSILLLLNKNKPGNLILIFTLSNYINSMVNSSYYI